MALGTACIMAFPGTKGIIGSLGVLVATMSKHVLVDGLIPPPPVMVMTALVLIAQFAAPEVWSRRAFIGFALLNAFTFTTNPLMVLTDSFPAITDGSEAFKLGSLLFEVIALYQVMMAILAAFPGAPLGLAYAWQAGLPILMKHVLLDKSGPPGPMIVLYVATLAAAWCEVGGSEPSPWGMGHGACGMRHVAWASSHPRTCAACRPGTRSAGRTSRRRARPR